MSSLCHVFEISAEKKHPKKSQAANTTLDRYALWSWYKPQSVLNLCNEYFYMFETSLKPFS